MICKLTHKMGEVTQKTANLKNKNINFRNIVDGGTEKSEQTTVKMLNIPALLTQQDLLQII